MSYTAPESYLRFAHSLQAFGGEGGTAWVGDAGFFVPRGEPSTEVWTETLLGRRWPGMHPDLLPFAVDGGGNLYCFCHSSAHAHRGGTAVLLWMYETYRAVPIASTFEHFIDWLGLSAWAVVQRGSDAIIDREHFDTVLRPVLEHFDSASDFSELLPEAYPGNYDVHRAFLRIDPFAPGSLVVSGLRRAQSGSAVVGLEVVARARDAFPDFTASSVAAALICQRTRDTTVAMREFERAIHQPLSYGGDPMMPFFGDVPEVDPSAIAEALAGHPLATDGLLGEPVWELINYDDPTSPQAWLQVAVDFANEGRLDDAVTMSCNAMHLAGNRVELAAEVLSLQLELYQALGRPWHHRVVEHEQEARTSLANRSLRDRRR